MSDVWRYISRDDNKRVCTICLKNFKTSTSTTSLTYHLKSNHNIEITKQQSGSQQRQPQVQETRHDGDLAHLFSKRRKMSKVEEKELDDSVVDFICMDMRPFAAVEGDGFKRMMKKATQDSYKIKARSTYHNMATFKYKKALRTLKELLSGVKDVCITTDMWTSNRLESYISITAHWLDDDLKLQQAMLTTEEISERHTGIN